MTPTHGEEQAGRLRPDGPRALWRPAVAAFSPDVAGSEQWSNNHRAATGDASGLAASAACLVAVVSAHGQALSRPLLFLCLYLLHVGGLLLMVTYRRRAYATWRKLLGTAATLHTAVNVRILATHAMRPDFCCLRGGGAPRLLVLLLAYLPAFWIALFSVHARLPLRWNVALLPLLTLATVSFGRSSCHALVQDADTHQAIDALYFWSSALTGAPLLPWGMPMARDATQPLQQCLVLDTWLTAALGVALPLLMHGWRPAAGPAALPKRLAPVGASLTYLLACALWAASAGLVALMQVMRAE